MVSNTLKPYTMITDFVTGKDVPNIGAEENRQVVERFLIEQKVVGYELMERKLRLKLPDRLPRASLWGWGRRRCGGL